MSDLRPRSAHFSNTRATLARDFRLPVLDLGAKSFIAVIDNRAERLRM
jgi:hypothetical protein